MHDALLVYFTGEKQAGLVLLAIGVVALAAAAVLAAPRLELRAFAVTLAIVGVLDVVIGGGLWLKTDPQVAALEAQLRDGPEAARGAEAARMERVQRMFVALEWGWVALFVGGAVVAIVLKHRPSAPGIALALCLQASVLLAFDLIAERRGAIYLSALKR